MKKRTQKELAQLPPVGWYDPVQLRRTAVQVAISTIFGQHADRRVLEALADSGDLQKRYYYEIQGRETQDFWFDYISDVGDGFDPTYTMALHLTRDKLNLSEQTAKAPLYSTERGEFVVFGGDEVYPIASFQDYKDRLTDPYSAAFPKPASTKTQLPKQDGPFAFAIPGNHDWYDSLVAFTDIFCSQRSFCGWDTIQNRSYFAIKLPRGWWLFGTDMQLGSSLDKAQVDYFDTVMKSVAPDDRIILCTPEPYWITEMMYEKDRAYINRNLGFFEGHVLRRQIAINIAGDRHYYRHHELMRTGETDIPADSKSKKHKIVAGGGGAFLHPTHNEHVDQIGKSDIYALKQSFPDEKTSWWLSFWILLFPVWNWQFGFVTGILYLLTAQAFFASMGAFSGPFGRGSITDVIVTFLSQPSAFFWVILIILAFVFFTDTHSKWYRRIAGPTHALVHLTAVFFIGWITSTFVLGGQESGAHSLWRIALAGVIIFLSGGVVGSAIMGFYLLVSLNVFSMHHNEAFSAVKDVNYKNFLRLKISANGDLTIFPIGVEKITKKWKPYDRLARPHISPANPNDEQAPFLIEEPIEFAKPYNETAGTADTGSLFAVAAKEL